MDIANCITLKNWCVVARANDPYAPPIPCLKGNVYGHPVQPDGQLVRTRSIKEVNGVYVLTGSHVYRLDNISQDYLDWCQNYYGPNWEFNAAEPITTIQLNKLT